VGQKVEMTSKDECQRKRPMFKKPALDMIGYEKGIKEPLYQIS